jgi:hypothetical protein
VRFYLYPEAKAQLWLKFQDNWRAVILAFPKAVDDAKAAVGLPAGPPRDMTQASPRCDTAARRANGNPNRMGVRLGSGNRALQSGRSDKSAIKNLLITMH